MRGLDKKRSDYSSKSNQFETQKIPDRVSNLTLGPQKGLNKISPQEQHKRLKLQLIEKQTQFHNKEKMYRIELFKNNKIKEQIQQVDKEFQLNKYKITLDLLQKNKNNKDSPLFYNENGLSPLELTLIEEKKYQAGSEESFVCMICFQDIEQNQIVIYLPCEHNFHKDCVIQHLLGSKYCPNCAQPVDLVGHYRKKFTQQQKGLFHSFF